ncbi:transglycosylase domain-containing protein [Subtercola boreus]|uniref:PASTA domain-containing protein n=1 Tax=Subtercola boreus TaxID=120213 RepID=A0A3E0WFG9_9MICO|nr:transglycosylase domain-containing protein [Subtercola boreus]RFA22787.1 hypothetical protein B7R24_04075 [Subtercola boreus]RFA23142.1 hypothetical protein B7R23_04070 [Subtercola boreus]RFA28895.1 hypothetical protein B7R25_04085 [Subtercola boreus]
MPRTTDQTIRTSLAQGAGALLGLVGLSAIAGVLVTAMVTPIVAVTGVTATSTLGVFSNLPEYIEPDKLAEKTNIYAVNNDGSPVLLASVFEQDREEVAWNQISQFAKDAVISTEDPRFYVHGGVDIAATARAALGNAASGGVESGASTISMQYVKNILVQRAEAITDPAERQLAYEEATQTSIDRKLKEMKLAIGLEKQFSKSDILLGYLNIASFGGVTYGIQSASRYYYGVDAANLTLAQAASLIATVNEPNGLRIDDPDNIAANQARRDLDILPSMLKANTITQGQYEEALATPVTPQITQASTGCSTANGIGAGFFCDYVGRVIQNQAVLGLDETGAPKSLSRGGYDVFTTLDVDLQTAAHAKLDAHVPASSSVLDLGASLVTVEPGTGKILAMAQNKTYNADPDAATPESTAVNYGTSFDYGGSTGFQVGSTYKIFTLAEWLEQSNALNDRLNGNQRTFDIGSFRNSCEGEGVGTYSSKNDGGSNPGTISVLNATASSVNNAYLAMAQRLDQCAIRTTAEAFGVARADGDQLTSYPSDVLGTNEIAPLAMAGAFAAVANEGVYCSPIAIARIVDSAGAELPVPASTCAAAVSPEVAATMAYALTGVVTNGTATASNPRNGIPHFGKTGTTDSEKDTWFVGSTTELSTAVWVGNVVGGVSLRNSSIEGVNGASLRHLVWKDYMTAADGKYGGEAFPAPDRALVQGVQVSIPQVTGLSVSAARSALTGAGFEVADGRAVASDQRAGAVARTDPSGSASRGAVVTVYPSDGSRVPQPAAPSPGAPAAPTIPGAVVGPAPLN